MTKENQEKWGFLDDLCEKHRTIEFLSAKSAYNEAVQFPDDKRLQDVIAKILKKYPELKTMN